MIYDHVKNTGLYKGLSPAMDIALDFIGTAHRNLPSGVALLAHGVKAIVSEYGTKLQNENGYEAHRRYIDIQLPLEGTEIVKCCPLNSLSPDSEYNEEQDYILFKNNQYGVDLQIGKGFFLVLFPDDAHMPQLCSGQPENIKKLTLKVPVK